MFQISALDADLHAYKNHSLKLVKFLSFPCGMPQWMITFNILNGGLIIRIINLLDHTTNTIRNLWKITSTMLIIMMNLSPATIIRNISPHILSITRIMR